jgi:DNA-binding transcriptional regulator YiaG
MSLLRPTQLSRIMAADGVPLTHVAERCDTSTASVCRWRLGRQRPRPASARVLEAMFGATVDELLAPVAARQ